MRRASPYARMLQSFEYLVLVRARWQLSLVWLVLFLLTLLPPLFALRRVLLIQFLLPRHSDHEPLLGTDHVIYILCRGIECAQPGRLENALFPKLGSARLVRRRVSSNTADLVFQCGKSGRS